MPVDRQWQQPRAQYAQPKVSAVITTRNEHPVLFVSIFAILEELEFWGYPFEFVIVSNCDTDLTPEILEHRFSHWLKTGQMKEERAWIAARQQMSLDELLTQAPWNLHETSA